LLDATFWLAGSRIASLGSRLGKTPMLDQKRPNSATVVGVEQINEFLVSKPTRRAYSRAVNVALHLNSAVGRLREGQFFKRCGRGDRREGYRF
jgi:hypothetical protein